MMRCLWKSSSYRAAGIRWTSSTTASPLQVTLEPLDDTIFTLTMNRPEAKNAISRQFLRELKGWIANLSFERSARCVILRSAVPQVFCAGADLKERATMSEQETQETVKDLRETFAALEALPIPIIASVDGYALGGGTELAMACDIRVCSSSAQFALPETRLGIIPGAGGTQRLPRIVGMPKAKELIFTGRRINAQEASKIGLADHLVDGDSGEERALQLAKEIAQGAPLALRMAKRAISLGMQTDLATGLGVEEACYAQVIPTEDRLEGLRSFAEKRPPIFTGN